MKKIRKVIMLFSIAITLTFQPLSVFAASTNNSYSTKEYLEDGSYFETIIESNENQKSTIKNASKTTNYKDANGNVLWYAKVTANFYYDGNTSSCTSSSASGGSYVSEWKILSKSSSRTVTVASATVTAGAYMGGLYVDSLTVKVLLSCDKNGNLS